MHQNFMRYTFKTGEDAMQEILIAELSEIGFDGFEQTANELVAFTGAPVINETSVTAIAAAYCVLFTKETVALQNWNALWESNFEPVIVNNKVAVRAAFHQPIKNIEYEIIITPKMSFGTGHHATTRLMMQQMCSINFKNKTVFDYGTGTGVLAILAEKLGAAKISAIDNDEWSIANAKENITFNYCRNIEIALCSLPPENMLFDAVMANINKNIILQNFSALAAALKPKGILLISGLLLQDESDIQIIAEKNSLILNLVHLEQQWICIEFTKKL